MAVTGWKNAGTATQVVAAPFDTGTLDWATLTNISATDNAYVTVGTGGPDTLAKGLQCHNYGITDADVPVGATIDGVEFQVENKKQGPNASTWRKVRIYTSAAGVGTDTAHDTTAGHDAADTYKVFGGATDKWGLGGALTQAAIKEVAFGIVFDAEGPPMPWGVDIDHAQMRVYFTAAASVKPDWYYRAMAALVALGALIGVLS